MSTKSPFSFPEIVRKKKPANAAAKAKAKLAAARSQEQQDEAEQLSRVKQVNNRYLRETLNDYERVLMVALNDWHTPQLRNTVAYKDKVNPNGTVNEFGTTFLHYACSKQDSINDDGFGPLEILILAGASIFARDDNGLLPYDYAKLKNNRMNVSIIQKEYSFQYDRYERQVALLGKIKQGFYLVERDDNKEEVEAMRAVRALFKEHGPLLKQDPETLTPAQSEMVEKMKTIKPVIREDEVANLESRVKDFEENSNAYLERVKLYTERDSGPKMSMR